LLPGNKGSDVPTDKPGRPTIRVEGTSVSVKWTAPVVTVGIEITGYVIMYGVAGSDPEQFAKEHVDPATTSYTFTEKLQPQTSYVFAVATETGDKEGSLSDFSDFSDRIYISRPTGYYLPHSID